MKISLHLGAHKTASTYLQKVLENNAEALLARRRLIVPMHPFREAVTQRLALRDGGLSAHDARRKERATAFLGTVLDRNDVDRVILTDENLLGTPRQMVLAGRPYPELERVLSHLPVLLSGHEVELFLSIRHQGDFSRSVFCESLRAPMSEFVSPEQFRGAWTAEPRSWLPLIADIRAMFPGSPLTVWDYRTMRGGVLRILNAVAGLEPPMDFALGGAFRRPSLTHDATVALLEIGRQEGPKAMSRRKEEMAKAHPRTPENRAFRMWEPEEYRAFNRQFAADMEALRAMDAGVTVLE